jgi:HSP20 family protein
MIARWFYDLDPVYNDFSRLTDVLDRVFDVGLPLANIRSVPRGTFPPVNVQEIKDGVAIQAYIPGVEAGSIEVTFHDNALTIKGKRDTAFKGTIHRRERFSGEFTRIIGLPEGLDPDKIKAQYRDGVLSITIDKMEEQKPKQIPVKIT